MRHPAESLSRYRQPVAHDTYIRDDSIAQNFRFAGFHIHLYFGQIQNKILSDTVKTMSGIFIDMSDVRGRFIFSKYFVGIPSRIISE